MTPLRVGTRGSRLARAQAQWVAVQLQARVESLDVELVPIETFGDAHADVVLSPELGQSFFTKEIESALLAGRVDVAVHSCKDLATVMPDGLRLGAIPEREDPRDVLVSRAGKLADLPDGSRVGTSSPRRKGFLAGLRPDIDVVDMRGNVPTRVAAVDEGRFDAVILAAAGLIRLGMSERISEWLDPDAMMPAAAQGALAVQTRDDDEGSNRIVGLLDHGPSRAQVIAERGCLRRMEAGCHAPLGALARAAGGQIWLEVALVAPGGVVRARAAGAAERAEAIGEAVAEELLAKVGLDSLASARWAGPPPLRAGAK